MLEYLSDFFFFFPLLLSLKIWYEYECFDTRFLPQVGKNNLKPEKEIQ